jgi:alkylation response protein AidB-like acyl-CoA dehydrogenase
MSWLGFQVIHFKLAELQAEIELLRAGIYQATDSFLEGQ